MQATRGTAVTERRTADPRRTWLLVGAALFVLALDVATKAVIVATLHTEGHPPISVVDGLLRIVYTRNSGAAFSIGPGLTIVFTALAAAVAAVIIRQARKLTSRGWAIALGLLLGGALGNLSDRIFRDPGPLRGHVVDWIQLPHWPVFNLADSAIVVGGVLAFVLGTRGIPMTGAEE